jgi:uncharacterized membrane protein HdeD (DUF308 family)
MPMKDRTDLLAELRELRKDWGWFLALGIGLIFAGVAAITVPLVATIGVVTVLGILLMAAGAAHIVLAFSCARWSGVLIDVLVGVLYVVFGFLILENPLAGAAGLTLLVAAMFFVGGGFRIVIALQERFLGWGWTLLNGAITLLLGIIIWRHLGEATLVIVGLLIGIELIFKGGATIMLAMTVRRIPADETEHGTASSKA